MVSTILPSASQKENMDRKETQRSIVQIAEKIKMERKEIQRTVLQVLRYNLKKKRWHEKNRLAVENVNLPD